MTTMDSPIIFKNGDYSDPKAFGPYHLLLLTLDFIFNWIIDWAHPDPLTVLVIFVFQTLALIVSLIVYVMASGSAALQGGLRKSLIYHHQLYLFTFLVYTTLSCYWYIWALRKKWPSVSDQFSFDFGSEEEMGTTLMPPTSTTTLMSFLRDNANATTPALLSPGNSTATANVTRILKTVLLFKNLLRPKSGGSGIVNKGIPGAREFYFALWSPGFIALYTLQRTVAIFYYVISLKSTFVLFNGGKIPERSINTNLIEGVGRRNKI